jgi:hypothetical protein
MNQPSNQGATFILTMKDRRIIAFDDEQHFGAADERRTIKTSSQQQSKQSPPAQTQRQSYGVV